MTTPAHAPFAPSAMERIALCPGSWRACAEGKATEQQSTYAADGTEAHKTLAWCVENNVQDADKANMSWWVHRHDTRDERIEAIQEALDYINEILASFDDAVVYVEKRVVFPSMVTEDCWGTADIIIIVPSLGWLYMIDFKYGAGKYVSAEDNLQTGTYTTASLAALCEGFQISLCIATIIQPRAFSTIGTIRSEAQSAEYYATVFRDKVDGIILNAMDETAPLVPGSVQCQFCPRKTNCPAREAAALQTVSTTFASVKDVTRAALPDVSTIPLDRLAYIMSAADMLKDWLKDVEKTAYDFMRAGVHIPGFKLVEAQARRQWEGDHDKVAQDLMLLTGKPLDEVMPRRLMTITDAEKAVVDAFKASVGRGRKKQAAEDGKRAMADLTTKQSTGSLVMVTSDDPRQPVDVTRLTFNTVTRLTFNTVAIPPMETE